jgi:hypothetical protein
MQNQTTTEPTQELVDSHHGIYAWQSLAQRYPLYYENGDPITKRDKRDLINTDDPDYWDTIAYLESELHVKHKNGELWRIEQHDGDIIAIHPDAEWNDYLNCYRLPRPDESILIIPEYVLCYLFNGDQSSLTTDELAQCDRLCDDWQYFTVLSEPYFSPTNDLNTLGGNCVDLAALPVTND